VTFGTDLPSSSIAAKTAEELIIDLTGEMFCLRGRQAQLSPFCKNGFVSTYLLWAIIEEIPLLASRRLRRWTETLPREGCCLSGVIGIVWCALGPARGHSDGLGVSALESL
jgi:hypothetical protein